MTSHSNESADFGLLRQIAKKELIHILEASPGPKDLVIEECLMKPLDKFAGMALLRQHETEKIFKLDRNQALPWSEVSQQRFYLIRPTMENSKFIADHVNSERKTGGGRKFVAVFVPRKLHVCEMVFEQQGVSGEIDVQEFNPSLIPIEPDILSLELPELFPSYFLDSTNQWLYTVAKSLWHLQSLFGAIPHVIGIGRGAEQTGKLIETLSWELGEPKPTPEQPFSHLFIVDRNLDYVSVFLSCLTYESLLDDCFNGIKCGNIEFPPEVSKTEKPLKYTLSSTDEVYSAIRDRHIARVHEFLTTRAKSLQSTYEKRHQMQEVREMREFVANDLKVLQTQHKSLSLHIGAIETIIAKKGKLGFDDQLQWERDVTSGSCDTKEAVSYIEDCMCQQLPEYQVLALICLLSLTRNGLGNKDYQSLRTQFLHAYGHKHLPTFFNLRKLGVVYEKDRPYTNLLAGGNTPASHANQLRLPSFQTIVKKLSLIPKEEDRNRGGADASYLFNGVYSPALCKVVGQCLQMGFNKEDLSRTFLATPVYVKENTFFPGAGKPAEPRIGKTIVVFFLGGVTYAEMAGLRLIAKQKGYRIVVATTHIINKQDLLRTIANA